MNTTTMNMSTPTALSKTVDPPLYLYHGTSLTRGRLIVNQGLRPLSAQAKGTAGTEGKCLARKGEGQSSPKVTYLTRGEIIPVYVFRAAECHQREAQLRGHPYGFSVIEVDVKHLNHDLLCPDEDFLQYGTMGGIAKSGYKNTLRRDGLKAFRWTSREYCHCTYV